MVTTAAWAAESGHKKRPTRRARARHFGSTPSWLLDSPAIKGADTVSGPKKSSDLILFRPREGPFVPVAPARAGTTGLVRRC